ncbi:MAG: hypothetical protein L3J07_01835 [Candidatus Magasanikbacteria bacterium]|nr:hypothetical protein [Candidatus Magasanikbacteria bacterium]
MIIPFFFHTNFYLRHYSNPFIIIDVEQNLVDKFIDNIHPDLDALPYCVMLNLDKLTSPINSIEKTLFLRRITITDKKEEDIYKLDFRTFFNIRYKKDVLTPKFDTSKINKRC